MSISYEVLRLRLNRKNPDTQTPILVEGVTALGLYCVLSNTAICAEIEAALKAQGKNPEQWHVAVGCDKKPWNCKKRGRKLGVFNMCSKLQSTVCINSHLLSDTKS